MSEQETREQFDDELLSAYVDGELTPGERARVEERLGGDPAARRLVEQLRSVSLAVQGLPREAAGDALREAILARTVRAAKADATDDDAREVRPRISVGRAARGWTWAGLAVAAALVIMVYQRGLEQQADVPRVVAQRVREGQGGRPGGDLELRAAAEPSPPSTGASDSVAFTVEDVAAPAAAGEQAYEGLVRQRVEPLSSAIGGGGALGDGESAAASVAAVAENQLLVVHVQVKPEAFRAKTFDGLLMRNGIRLEDSVAGEPQPLSENEAVATGQSKLEESRPAAPQARQQLDAVLVDAPAAQIESCLVELDTDTDNYWAVAVDDEAVQSAAANKALSAANWKQQYSRGNVLQKQKVQWTPGGFVGGGGGRGGAVALDNRQFGAAPNAGPAPERSVGEAKLARARRVQVAPLPEQSPAAADQADRFPAEGSGWIGGRLLVRGGDAPPSDASDSVQVLFVLSCDSDTTPSPAAANRAE